MNQKQADRARDAHHEAAHAISFYCLTGLVPWKVSVTKMTGGHYLRKLGRKNKILVCLAGPAAEYRHLRECRRSNMTLWDAWGDPDNWKRKDFQRAKKLIGQDRQRPYIDAAEGLAKDRWRHVAELAQLLLERGCLRRRFLRQWFAGTLDSHF